MKRIKSYFSIVMGALIIALAINIFFVGRNLIPNGVLGFALLYSKKFEMNVALAILLVSLFMLTLGYITISKKKILNSILPILLVPLFIYLTQGIRNYIDVSMADYILISVFGGILIGIGSKYIYKEERMSTASDIINEISCSILGANGVIINYIIDVTWVIIVVIVFGLEQALYAAISIIIIEMMSHRTSVGVSEAKVFYIITSEERKVKRFIMNDLRYDITIFDVKGGYSQNKNRVLMTAIPTKDYYKLREGIRELDPNAFISITDSYELINENVQISTKK